MRLNALHLRFLHGWRKGAISRKAVSFALIGVVNAFVDYGVFFLARAVFAQWPAALALFAAISGACRCAGADTVSFIVANLTSWAVAVTGSYILNASITFAAESGRKLRWRAYAAFAASEKSPGGSPTRRRWCSPRKFCCCRSRLPKPLPFWRASPSTLRCRTTSCFACAIGQRSTGAKTPDRRRIRARLTQWWTACPEVSAVPLNARSRLFRAISSV